MAKSKKITLENVAKSIEDLALTTARGFEANQKEFEGIHKEFEGIYKKFEGVHIEFEGVHKRLDRIENLLIQDHTNRIERLEDKMMQIETAIKK